MDTTLPLRSRFVLGCNVLVLLVALAATGLASAAGEFDDGLDVRVRFPDGVGMGLDHYSDVRVRGVSVGSVRGIELQPSGQVEVELRLDPTVQVPASVEASVEPLSVFGPRFIDLVPPEPVTDGPWLEDGSVINRGGMAVELGDLVADATALLRATDPAAMATIQRSLADGLEGRGQDLADGVDAMDGISELLDDRRPATRQLVADLRAVSDTFRDRGGQMTSVARTYAAVLPVLTATEAPLVRTLDRLIRISADFAALLRAHEHEVEPLVDGLQRTATLLRERTDQVPDLLGVFGDVFAALAAITRLPMDDGSLSVAVDLFVPGDICSFVQVCAEVVPEELRDQVPLAEVLEMIAAALEEAEE